MVDSTLDSVKEAPKAGAKDEQEALINLVAKDIQKDKGPNNLLINQMPDSTLGKYGLVTAKGLANVPAGMGKSVMDNIKNPLQLVETVAMGAGMAVVLKAVIPEATTAGKLAGAAIGAYFTYKAAEPIYEGYKAAGQAKNMEELDLAAVQIGDAGGSFIVNGAIAVAGYKLGSRAMDRALATAPGMRFIDGRNNFYDGVANKTMNLAESMNIIKPRAVVGPEALNARPVGAIPPYVMEELARRNPNNPDFMKTHKMMMELQQKPFEQNGVKPRNTSDSLGTREVYDAQGKEVHPGTRARFEGDKPHGNAMVDNAYDQAGTVRDFYKDVHGRLSIDGKGMKYSTTVNYGQNYENAFWDGTQMTYGTPGPSSPFKTFVLLDIAGHEITHGVTQMESGMRYRNQSGALNESMSDVWGSLIKQWKNKQTADKADWLVGEGIWKENVKGKALRDMKNPGTAYNDPAVGKDPQPGHMKDYNHTRGDNGGVHYNSGIPNRAFALFAEDVGGFAWEGPGKIWWAARRAAGNNPNFGQFAHHTIEQAKLLGHTELVPKLQKAWDGVGVVPSLKSADIPTIPGGDNGTGGDGHDHTHLKMLEWFKSKKAG